MYNTLQAILKLHELGYLYRDVKPSNFMLTK
jgi:serine/threonine protein kinase